MDERRWLAGGIPAPGTRAAALMMLCLLVGCAGLQPTPAPVSVEPTVSRAERVFLYQSRVADALLDHYPLLDAFQEADPALIAAEERMTETCSPLTRAVLAELEGEKPSLGLRFKVLTTLDDCERAARRIDRLLHSVKKTERAAADAI